MTGGIERCPAGVDNNDVNLEADQLGREVGEPLGPPLGISALDRDVLAFDVAELAKSLLECLDEWRDSGRGTAEESDLPDLHGLLRLDGERGGEEATRQSNHEDGR